MAILPTGTTWLLFGGCAVFLLAHLTIRLVLYPGRLTRARIVALTTVAVIIIVGALHPLLPPVGLLAGIFMLFLASKIIWFDIAIPASPAEVEVSNIR